MMKLYTYFRSSASFRVRIALNYKGIDYEPQFINLPKGAHHESTYKAVNALGLVPALDDSGTILAESLAIIEYLDEVHPGPKLMPSDPVDRAYVRAVAQIVACEIHPLNNLRALKYVKKAYAQDEEGINRYYRHWINDGFQMLEAFLVANRKVGTYAYLDQVSLADCCLVPQVFNAQRYDCDLNPYPTVMKIFEACMRLPAFIDAQPSKQPDAS